MCIRDSFEADEKAIEYLKEHGREPKAVYHSDPDEMCIRDRADTILRAESISVQI